MKEINQTDEKLRSYRENLDELQQEKEEINRAIERIENEVHRLERDIPGIREQLDQLRNNEPEIVDIIHIVNFYLECTRRNKIVALREKYAFKRRNPLYKQYEQKINELKLARRNRIELEEILQEKLEKQNEEREKITKLQNELNEREREIGEKKKELLHKKEELKSVERSHASLSENIGSGERKLKKLKNDIDSLAHGKLEYDRDALRRENPELRGLYNGLSNKQSEKNQKESDLKEKEQKRIDLSGLIERLMNSVGEKIKEIKAAEQEMQKEMREKMDEAKLAILKEKQIIATTNLRTYNKLFESINFDLIIMDEAGAIDLPGAVLPFLKGNKFILLGDPEQLQPILVDRPPEIRRLVEQNPGLRLSIFERFYESNHGDNQVVMLTSQYRMKSEIADFVSSSFYGGRLNSSPEAEINEKLRECPDDIISNCYSMVCFPRRFWTDYESGSAFSLVEIDFIKKIIKKFRHEYGKRIYEEIAIISPYRAQIGRIEDEIPDIECGTVHTFQGQEKSIIIFATANYRKIQNSGFGYLLEGPASKNLLNVAVSRAKEKFIIVGSRELFVGVPIYTALYEHIQEVGYENRQNCCRMCGEEVPEGRLISKFLKLISRCVMTGSYRKRKYMWNTGV
jgi:superfamily I DNA and/or RNA helicase